VAFVSGADLYIGESQYADDEYPEKIGWVTPPQCHRGGGAQGKRPRLTLLHAREDQTLDVSRRCVDR
jgi:hypothetical protein